MLRLAFFFGFSAAIFATNVTLNGTQTEVHFNDGDTFRVLGGQWKGKSARIKGVNTLESYGPVHQWGNWRGDELLDNAKAATENAQQGTWHCQVDSKKDTYGRLLAICQDLAESQIKKGLAHVMFMNQAETNPSLVKLQQEAIKNRAGMWHKGAPDYLLTSLHSPSESDLKGDAYDRFVSTRDGLSLVKTHSDAYATCQKVQYSPNRNSTASSMLYVPFEQRYRNKPSCL